MIVYFSKLAKAKDEEENVDLNFVEHLFDSGADINFPDKHGQTVLHEVSEIFSLDQTILESAVKGMKASLLLFYTRLSDLVFRPSSFPTFWFCPEHAFCRLILAQE